MEEKKVISLAKEEKKAENTAQPKEYSYEELKTICTQLSEQCQQLWDRVQRVEMELGYRRLDYLFKVIEFRDAFSKKFAIECAHELEAVLSIPKEEEPKENQ